MVREWKNLQILECHTDNGGTATVFFADGRGAPQVRFGQWYRTATQRGRQFYRASET